MNFIRKIIGLIFIAIPFLPAALLFENKKIKGAGGSFGPYQWFLGIIIIIFLSYVLSLTPLDKVLKKFTDKLDFQQNSKRFFWFCVVTTFFFLNACALICFRHRPHLVDSIVQLFQAKIFAAGMLKATAPKFPEFFISQYMIFDQTGWYSQYPPGHQALLAIGVLLGAPWLVNIVLTVISVIFAYKISLKIYGEQHANISLFLATFCPFLIFMGSDYMNHVPTLTCITLFAYYYICWEEERKAKHMLFSAFAIGFAFLIRPLTALGMAIPFGISALVYAKKNKLFSHIILGAIGSGIFVALNFLYNKAMYGEYMLPGYVKLWGKSHDIGFHVSPWGESHTPLTGIRNELADVSLINEYLFEWPIPILFFIGLYLFFSKNIKKTEKLFLCSFLMLPATYFFYWHRDAYLGPRFMYESVFFLIFLTSSALIKIAEFAKDKRIGLKGIFKFTSANSVFAWSILLSFVYALSVGIPTRFTIYASSMKSMKFDILERAKEQKIDKALIFVKISWGARLMSELRGYGVSASLVQDAYLHTDHCRLQELLDTAHTNNSTAEELSQKVNELLNKREPIKIFYKHTDPTLKLTGAEALSERCKNELAYDTSSDFAVYIGHFNANNPELNGDYVVATDLREKNKLLLEHYKDYPAYIYLPDKFVKIR